MEGRLRIVSYDRELLSNFVYKGTDRRFNELVDMRKLVHNYALRGSAYVGLLDGEPVGAGGIMRIYTGVGMVWLLFNPEAEPYTKSIYKRLKYEIDKAFNEDGYWRLQTECSLIDKNIRLLRHLGFRQECLKRKAGINGEDMLLFAKLKEEA